MSNAFHQARHDSELKLMLLNSLDNFDANLAESLQASIQNCNDREILEFIVSAKIKKLKENELIKEFFIFLSNKNPGLISDVRKCFGEDYLQELLKK